LIPKTTMSKTAKRARIAAVIKLLCDQFPQTFSRHDPRPLKVRVDAELLVALDAIEPRGLQSALRAYTSTARYVSALRAGACRIDLDGKPAGTVTAEDEKAAKAKLAEFKKGASPRTQVPPAGEAGPEAPRDETRRGKPEVRFQGTRHQRLHGRQQTTLALRPAESVLRTVLQIPTFSNEIA
jgi:ProP effector